MNTFQVSILSLERPFYVGECVSLVVPVTDGMLGIQANHPPFTAAIVGGPLTFTLPDGTRRVCAVSRGMIDISKNDPRILCESIVAPEEVENEKARRALEDAMIEIDEAKGRRDYITSQIAFAKAFNDLKIKNRKSIVT